MTDHNNNNTDGNAFYYSNQRLELISTIANQLLSNNKPQEIIQEICEKVMAFLKCDLFFNYLVDEEKQRLHLNAHAGISRKAAKEFEWLNFGEAICGLAIQRGKRIIYTNIHLSEDARTSFLRSVDIKAYAANPFLSKGNAIGCLSFGTKSIAFTDDELSVMAAVASQVGVALARKRIEESLERQKVLQEGINRIFQEALSDGTEESLGELCLSIAEDLTQSTLGFISEVNKDGMQDIATINPSWKNCKVTTLGQRAIRETFKIHGLYGKVLLESKSFYTNDPSNHPARIGLPPGHPPLNCFLGVPLINKGKAIGMIGVGNRRDGYSQADVDSLEALAPSIMEAFLRKRAEVKLERYNKQLEAIIAERSKELQEKERLAAIGATAGMVGHDIRNPLQAMVNDVYLLKDSLVNMPGSDRKVEITESLEGIEENIGYINKIVADLQDYARPLNPEYSSTNLSELVFGIFKTIPVPDNINLSIKVNVRELKTDPLFIRRALTNLVNNAIQAMPTGGNLQVSGFRLEDKVYLTITDTGIGIPEDVKPKLFVPMMTTKAKGQGLGLAVVKRLIESLNGNVTFESQVDKGTVFIISLPD